MMRRSYVALMLSLVFPASLVVAMSGTWAFSSESLPPDLTCEFATKDGAVDGTCSAVGTRLPIAGGKIDGKTVQWTINVPSDVGAVTAYLFAGELDEQATTMQGTITISNVIGTERGTFSASRR